MTSEELLQKYRQAFDFLSRKGIMELRMYGRAFGVRSPSAKHKRDLIEDIIKIAAGLEPRPPATNKGARVLAKPISDEEIKELHGMVNAESEKLQNMFDEITETAPRPAAEEIFLNGRQGTYILRGKLTVRENGAFSLSLEGDMEQS